MIWVYIVLAWLAIQLPLAIVVGRRLKRQSPRRRMTAEQVAALELELGLREMTDEECDAELIPRLKYTQRGYITHDMRSWLREEMRRD